MEIKREEEVEKIIDVGENDSFYSYPSSGLLDEGQGSIISEILKSNGSSFYKSEY